ncbi:hypothetical protein M3Y99_00186600 [Aphelenchoides fujianensis]|nr:hypothetical protein M3Y99_00186600 [Aphelenchoides fujianensis]
MAQYASTTGTSSPQPSLRSGLAEDVNGDALINLQIFVPELQLQKCLTVPLDEIVWDIKRKLFASLPQARARLGEINDRIVQALQQSFNFGLFLPPCDGRAGKFLLEDRPIRDYPFHDCVPYLELKYKKRVYKMLKLDEKALKQLHSKSNLKKFMDYVVGRNAEKVDKWCAQGLDPNFHDAQGETPLTLAAGIPKNRDVLVSLVGGGAHVDFRNSEGQTGMHKAAFLSIAENVRALLELGASPNYRDPIGLTPLYYCMLTTDSLEAVAQMLLSEASEIGVTDMHGNHEIHQACKNGLLKHVENLLYYGAEINAQNINGNTPLHVCAVNNRPDCARTLLFRGADPFIMNKQGQTALHVAHIVGNSLVADIIQGHNPGNAVPFRGTPKYNTRRRMGSQILRRRSMSQSSICSAQSDRCYQTPQLRHSASVMPSPSMSRASTSNHSEYGGTLRRYPPESVQAQMAGFEANIPRILVIPRGPKGFGFILRGTKHVDSQMDFQPTPATPALQFFEGVDMSGMAMKAGLRPGDFLLEINGVDVRCSNHEQVVQLIHQSQDTISLKVITVDPAIAQQPLYTTNGGTLPSRRNQSVPRGLPPMPPQRHPSTSLSSSYGHHTMGYSPENSADSQQNGFVFSSPGDLRLFGAKSSESLSVQSIDSSNFSEHNRCASVKSRPSARRISAAELEHLMIRQSTSQFQPMAAGVYEQETYEVGQGGPRKFTSVADMKRRKQRGGVPSPSMSGLPRSATNGEVAQQAHVFEGEMQPMKSFNSSPDLQAPIYDQTNGATFQVGGRKSPTEYSDYSRPCRGVLRPKTPPPPPPPVPESPSVARAPPPMAKNEKPRAPTASSVPPPPPPPPPGFLSTPMKAPAASTATTSGNHAPPPPPPPPSSAKSDCRGISADALCSVQLKPVNNNTLKPPPKAPSASAAGPSSSNSTPPKPPVKKSLDFDTDLRSALAKRRSKLVTSNDDQSAESANNSDDGGHPAVEVSPPTTRPYGGLSLRESVRENVQPSAKTPPKAQHSPPGFAAKKDSGYTSSRTSLEPSEYGDDHATPLVGTPTASPVRIGVQTGENGTTSSQFALGASTRVTLISQQLEDTFITPSACKPQYNDTISIASTLSNFSSSSAAGASGPPNGRGMPELRTPPVDYEQDSGTGDSDHDSASAAPSAASHDCKRVGGMRRAWGFAVLPTNEWSGPGLPSSHAAFDHEQHRQKEVIDWSLGDVLSWLEDLGLSEYAPLFSSSRIVGRELVRFDRGRYAQLGVTRISHRPTNGAVPQRTLRATTC